MARSMSRFRTNFLAERSMTGLSNSFGAAIFAIGPL
jgi:hypothetical protein